jgi:hypothetical protein
MPNGNEQASAYLSEAETTLQSARVLFEDNPEAFASQIVKNAYDALEQALSAGIAARGGDIPRRHGAKIQRYFKPLNRNWNGRRSTGIRAGATPSMWIFGVRSYRFHRRTSTGTTRSRFFRIPRNFSNSSASGWTVKRKPYRGVRRVFVRVVIT